MLDCVLPASPQAVCHALFGPTDGHLLLHHLRHGLGCTGDLDVEPWRPAVDGSGGWTRRLRYAVPLSAAQRLLLPLGPPAVPNDEAQQLLPQPGGGYTLTSRVCSSGVPFSDAFANHVQWTLEPAASGTGAAVGAAPATHLRVTAACRFHRPVIGPLRGRIQGESMQVRGHAHAGAACGNRAAAPPPLPPARLPCRACAAASPCWEPCCSTTLGDPAPAALASATPAAAAA